MKYFIINFLALILVPLFAFAQDSAINENVKFQEIEVNESLEEDRDSSLGRSFLIEFTEENEANSSELRKALGRVPSLVISRTPGQESFTLQGVSSHQISVTQDGFSFSNPVGTQRDSDFFLIGSRGLVSLEVHPGNQSAWFGHNAFGGHIELKKNWFPKKTQTKVSLEGGSFGTFSQSLELNQKKQGYGIQTSLSHEASKGISAAKASLGNPEQDGFESLRLNTRLSVRLGKQTKAFIDLVRNTLQNDLDQGGGAFKDDPNYESNVEQWMIGSRIEHEWIVKRFQSDFSIQYQTQNRNLSDLEDDAHIGQSLHGDYFSRQVSFETGQKVNFSNIQVEVGYRFDQESAQIATKSQTDPLPLFETNLKEQASLHQAYFRSGGRFFNRWENRLAFRYLKYRSYQGDWAAQFETEFGIIPEKGFVFGRIARGARYPSLYQRYSKYGNPDLKRESVVNYAFGVKTRWNKENQSQVSFFKSDFKDLIDYSFSKSLYENQSGTIFGVEFSSDLWIAPTWRMRPNYTWQWTYNKTEAESMLRRPRHIAGLSSDWYLLKRKLNLSLNWKFVGSREDIIPGSRVTLEAYHRFDLMTSYRLNRSWSVYGRLENLLNADYEEIFGYGVSGRAGYLGARAVF